jgi:hypothetical protein
VARNACVPIIFVQTENNFIIQKGFVITTDIGFMWTARITHFLSTRSGYIDLCLRNCFLSWKEYFSHSRHGSVIGPHSSTYFISAQTTPKIRFPIISQFVPSYNKFTSTKTASFCITTFSVSLTNLTSLVSQSHDCSSITSRIILTPPPLWLQKHTDQAHTNSRTLPHCGISLGSLQPPAPEDGVFVELILLHQTDLYP